MAIENYNHTSALDFARLGQLRARSNEDGEKATKEVSQQFESLFINMMLQAMRKATERSGLTDSSATETYEQLFDQEVASSLSNTGAFGIAEAIERQIRLSKGIDRSDSRELNPRQSERSFSLPPKDSFVPESHRKAISKFYETAE